MKAPYETQPGVKQPVFVMKSGRLWFTRKTERRLYFALTLIMLAFGLLYKTGWL